MSCNQDIFFYLPRTFPFFGKAHSHSYFHLLLENTPPPTHYRMQVRAASRTSARPETLHVTHTGISRSFYTLGLKEKGQTLLLCGQGF